MAKQLGGTSPPNRSMPKTEGEGWKQALSTLKLQDEGMAKAFEDDINSLLTFAGLFSAVLTAFLIESYKTLQTDPAETSAQILRRISQQMEIIAPASGNLSGTTIDSLPTAVFAAPLSAVAVNTLWFLGLVLSLAAALLGIFLKQWLRSYIYWTDVTPARDAVAMRQLYHQAFLDWQVPELRSWIQAFLQIALILFLVGLLLFLWTLNYIVFGVLTAAVGISLLFALFTIVVPVFSAKCPYKSSLAWLFAHPVLRLRRRYSRWRSTGRRPPTGNDDYPIVSLGDRPLPDSWRERDEMILLPQKDPKVPTGWHPQHEALVLLLSTSHDDGLMEELESCLSSLKGNQIALTLTLSWKVMGFLTADEMLRQLGQQFDYNTPSYYGAAYKMQNRFADLHPRVAQMVTSELVKALWVCTRGSVDLVTNNRVAEMVCLLDVLVWSTSNAQAIGASVHALAGLLWSCCTRWNAVPMPDKVTMLRDVVASRLAAITNHSHLEAVDEGGINYALRSCQATFSSPNQQHAPMASTVIFQIAFRAVINMLLHYQSASTTPDTSEKCRAVMESMVRLHDPSTDPQPAWAPLLRKLALKLSPAFLVPPGAGTATPSATPAAVTGVMTLSASAQDAIRKLAARVPAAPPPASPSPPPSGSSSTLPVLSDTGREARYSADGVLYYIDHNAMKTLRGDLSVLPNESHRGPLPPGYELGRTRRAGKDTPYFFDRKTMESTYDDPRRRRDEYLWPASAHLRSRLR